MKIVPKNNDIQWGISSSPCGNMLIACSTTGIVFLSFFETDSSHAYQQLLQDWPKSKLTQNDRLVIELTQHIFLGQTSPPLELDLRGTDFQLQVWNALLKIPKGKTATYHQIADQIGQPNASRAVGNAIGKNPISYLIPCHRVIRTDGTLGGYRWGTTCKARLLAQEKIS
jgi:AraC family transcriptional regulator, regulatory protein of adaptative response / methylated-DNA-[protein]-cysteine methyltransferase